MSLILYKEQVASKSHAQCEDSVDVRNGSQYVLFAVADGHGDPACARSAKGSKFAIEVAFKMLETLVEGLLEPKDKDQAAWYNDLQTYGASARVLKQMGAMLPKRWREKTREDLKDNPITHEEYEQVAARKRAWADNPDEHLYGSTLLAGVLLQDYIVLLQQGDGCCTLVYADGSVRDPLPEDERCIGNVTTSLCDADASRSMRFAVVDLRTNKPVACFVGTDGVDKSLAGYEGVADFFGGVVIDAVENSKNTDVAAQLLKQKLTELRDKGAGDDTSVAGFVDVSRASRCVQILQQKHEEFNRRLEQSNREAIDASGARRYERELRQKEAIQASLQKSERNLGRLVITAEELGDRRSATTDAGELKKIDAQMADADAKKKRLIEESKQLRADLAKSTSFTDEYEQNKRQLMLLRGQSQATSIVSSVDVETSTGVDAAHGINSPVAVQPTNAMGTATDESISNVVASNPPRPAVASTRPLSPAQMQPRVKPTIDPAANPKKSKTPLVIGVISILAIAAVAYVILYSGNIMQNAESTDTSDQNSALVNETSSKVETTKSEGSGGNDRVSSDADTSFQREATSHPVSPRLQSGLIHAIKNYIDENQNEVAEKYAQGDSAVQEDILNYLSALDLSTVQNSVMQENANGEANFLAAVVNIPKYGSDTSYNTGVQGASETSSTSRTGAIEVYGVYSKSNGSFTVHYIHFDELFTTVSERGTGLESQGSELETEEQYQEGQESESAYQESDEDSMTNHSDVADTPVQQYGDMGDNGSDGTSSSLDSDTRGW